MLKKLLRYDLAPIFKYWWIAALTTFILSFFGGFALTILRGGDDPPFLLFAFSVITMMLTVLANVAFVILAEILAYVRYYRNFYTDEGYLTFTLPVKTTTLINSKLIMSIITMGATFLMIMINIITIILVTFGGDPDFWKELNQIISELWKNLDGYLVLYACLAILLALAFLVFSNLLIFLCITVAALLAKKAKVFCAIAMIYGVSGVFSTITQLFGALSLYGAFAWLEQLPAYSVKPMIAAGLAVVLTLILSLSALCYLGHYRMIDRKLNLA